MRVVGKHTMVFGLKGAGKSNFVQWLLTEHESLRNALIIDVCREHQDLHRYVPEHRSGKEARAEMSEVVKRFVTENHRGLRPDVLVGEEVNRYAPNSGGTPDALLDLIDLNRHYGVGFIGIARRPAQCDTTLVELADNIIVFAVRGTNDRKRLNNEAPGAGDAAADLEPYQFLRIQGDRTFDVYSPVPEMDTTGAL